MTSTMWVGNKCGPWILCNTVTFLQLSNSRCFLANTLSQGRKVSWLLTSVWYQDKPAFYKKTTEKSLWINVLVEIKPIWDSTWSLWFLLSSQISRCAFCFWHSAEMKWQLRWCAGETPGTGRKHAHTHTQKHTGTYGTFTHTQSKANILIKWHR